MVHGLATIPIELVNSIVDQLPSNSVDIRNLRSVNKLLNVLATPRSFLCIHVGDSLKGAHALKSIMASPTIATTVQEIIYSERCFGNLPLESIQIDHSHFTKERKRFHSTLESAIATMYQLPRLKSLSLNFWPNWHSERPSAIKDHRVVEFVARQKSLRALYTSDPHPSLKSLVVTNLCLLYPRVDRHRSRRNIKATFLTQLQDLSISFLSDAEHAQVAEGDTRPVVPGPRDHLPPSHSHLRSLTLQSPRGLFHTHDLCPHSLFYPNLTTLSLENIVLGRPSSSGGMISFILSHKSTLRKLELRSCPVIISDCATDSLRYWSQIWDRFATELSDLTDLTLTHGHFGTGYKMFVEDKELETIILSPLRSQADEAALENFRQVVTERRAKIK